MSRSMLIVALVVGVFAVAASGGCIDYTIDEGAFRCDPDSGGSCPSGMACAWSPVDQQYRCFRNPPDQDGGPQCGNGVKDGDEECDGSDVGGETCESQGYPPGFLGCTDQCAFDFSTCGAEGNCGDGEDNDNDGLTDCDDPECIDEPCGPDGQLCLSGVCECPGGAVEADCTDAVDDDCDGQTDCDDSDCEQHTSCLTSVCQALDTLDCGEMKAHDTIDATNVMNTYSCYTADEGGPEFVYAFDATTDATVYVTLSGLSVDLNLYVLDGSAGICHPDFCAAFSYRGGSADEEASFFGVSGTTYYIVVDAAEGASGQYDIHLACGQCGDTVVDPGEDCDDGGESATCDADCTQASCGDGQLNVTAGEECDDGNNIDGDGCSSTCQLDCISTNIALDPGVVATSSGGGSAALGYGPDKMIDGFGEAFCDTNYFHWISAESWPAGEWAQLEWPANVTVARIDIDTTWAYDDTCVGFGRTTAGGLVQYWNGSGWTTDGTVMNQEDDWSYIFTAPVQTSRIRIFDIYATDVTGNKKNPVIVEWQVFGCP